MAQQIGGGKFLKRAGPRPPRQFLAEATAAAQAAGEILSRRYGQQPWIEQVCTAVQNAVQNGIENLSGTSISSNSHKDDGYRFAARRKEELIASQKLVAPGPQDAELPETSPEYVQAQRPRIIIPGAPPPKAQPAKPASQWLL